MKLEVHLPPFLEQMRMRSSAAEQHQLEAKQLDRAIQNIKAKSAPARAAQKEAFCEAKDTLATSGRALRQGVGATVELAEQKIGQPGLTRRFFSFLGRTWRRGLRAFTTRLARRQWQSAKWSGARLTSLSSTLPEKPTTTQTTSTQNASARAIEGYIGALRGLQKSGEPLSRFTKRAMEAYRIEVEASPMLWKARGARLKARAEQALVLANGLSGAASYLNARLLDQVIETLLAYHNARTAPDEPQLQQKLIQQAQCLELMIHRAEGEEGGLRLGRSGLQLIPSPGVQSSPSERLLVRERIKAHEAELGTFGLQVRGKLEFDGLASAGTSPVFFLKDHKTGERFVFKALHKRGLAAELVAAKLQAAAKRPHVPVIPYTFKDAARGTFKGVLKPMIPTNAEAGKLNVHTENWNAVQRTALLATTAWDWILQNFDTHGQQFILTGPDGYPVCIDYDNCFLVERGPSIDRHQMFHPLIAPIRNFLYADYIEGKIDLDFAVLREEVAHIHAIDDQVYLELLSEYAKASGHKKPEDFLERALRRKRELPAIVEEFIKALKTERAAAPTNLIEIRRQLQGQVKDGYQRTSARVHHSPAKQAALQVLRGVRRTLDGKAA